MNGAQNGTSFSKVAGHNDAPVVEEPRELFRHLAHWTAEIAGSVWIFGAALTLIFAWLITGPLFRYSDAWQLVINTGTTIITFLMVFLIQNTQNRDAKAIHLKLDELIRVSKARDQFMNLEALSDKELAELSDNLTAMRAKAVERLAEKTQRISHKGGG